jgi:hypothetical protein
MPSTDPAREFFLLAHAIIACEMTERAVPRLRAEPEEVDPLHFWFAWRSQQGFGNQAEIYR